MARTAYMATGLHSPEVMLLSVLACSGFFSWWAVLLVLRVVFQLLVTAGADDHDVRTTLASKAFSRGRQGLKDGFGGGSSATKTTKAVSLIVEVDGIVGERVGRRGDVVLTDNLNINVHLRVEAPQAGHDVREIESGEGSPKVV